MGDVHVGCKPENDSNNGWTSSFSIAYLWEVAVALLEASNMGAIVCLVGVFFYLKLEMGMDTF
jgi:hypothetical protein